MTSSEDRRLKVQLEIEGISAGTGKHCVFRSLGISLHLTGGIVGAENAVGRCKIPHTTTLHSLRGICHLHQQYTLFQNGHHLNILLFLFK